MTTSIEEFERRAKDLIALAREKPRAFIVAGLVTSRDHDALLASLIGACLIVGSKLSPSELERVLNDTLSFAHALTQYGNYDTWKKD